MDSNFSEPSVLVKQWRHELTDALKEQTAVSNKIWALKKMIEGIEVLHPEIKVSPPIDVDDEAETVTKVDPKPVETAQGSAAEVVRGILRRNPNSWYTSGAMVKEFSRLGRRDTPTAIRLALRRTATTGVSEKRGVDKHQNFRLLVEDRNDDNPPEVF